MEAQRKHLYRSRTHRVIAGICGGICEYLNADPTLIRLAWIVLTLLGGSGIVIYIIAYFVIPLKPIAPGETDQPVQQDFTAGRVFGILFVALGAIILLDNLDIISFHRWWHLSWEFAFPAFLILAGLYFLARRRKSSALPSEHPPEGEPMNQPSGGAEKKGAASKTLHRSRTDKKILGICAGLAEYFDIDPTIVRVAFVLFIIFSGGIGILLYFLLYLIIPEAPPQPSVQE
jgi:phage shock protein PspC (stress-responsive transcriptional regulator)